ncbi:MAG TPA: SMC-Scp complex subunit ScpB [Polyangiaceae bacterium]|nr:SMC-Scp complex subunit ScpB [Polyangiaceae bacterium]
MTTRKKKTQPARRAPARAARGTPVRPAAPKGGSPKKQEEIEPATEDPSAAKKTPTSGARRAQAQTAKHAAKKGRKVVQEDALPLDVLGEIDEMVLDSSLLLDAQRSDDTQGGDQSASGVHGSDRRDESLGDSDDENQSSADEPSDADDAGTNDEGESVDELEAEQADERSSPNNSRAENHASNPEQESSEGNPEDSESSGVDGSEASEDAEQGGAAVYELSDFLRPQREDAPIVDATGPDTPEAVAGDELGTDTSANDTETFLKCALEAVMFASDKPLTVRDIAKALQLDRRRAQEILTLLRSDYENRGFRIDEVADGFAFRSHPKIADYVRAFLEQKPVKLSRAQLETLAIVAYRQPITRPETDDIRGVDCGPVLKGLLERDLIRVIGKKDEPGRPMLYGTTPAFLELFGLKSLEELPTLKEFTELTDESRRKFENEMGEEAPIGLADFGLSNSDENAAQDAGGSAPEALSAQEAPEGDTEPSCPAEGEDAGAENQTTDEDDGLESLDQPSGTDEDESDDDEDESDDDEDESEETDPK